ncbi:MAG: TonB protein [Acidobacteria bacterium]|nr:TonB protein [Acidobacteriota bacterium]
MTEAQQQLARMRVPRLLASTASAPTPVPPKLSLPEVSAPAVPLSELPKAPVPPTPAAAETRRLLAQIRVPRMPVPAVSAPTPLPPAIAPSAEITGLPTLVAVGIAPAPPPPRVPLRIPLGNRSGEFAVSPEGDKEIPSLPGQPGRNPDAREPAPELPNVGEIADIRVPHLSITGDRTSAVAGPVMPKEPDVTAAAPPPPAPAPPAPPTRDLRALMARAARSSLLPDAPRARGISADAEFFGGQHVQTVYINMPNLTSGTGSWILRFAERDEAGREDGEITSPVAVKKVDPKYAPAAVRDRVEGTVTLAAQILRDGRVASVEVVRGLDPRLDLSAVQALTLWVFEPARKKGVPIDLDVLVQIPFRLPAF